MSLKPGAQSITSSFCNGGGQCVEVSRSSDGYSIHVDDSADPNSPMVRFGAKEWKIFVARAKEGEFDA
jgi:hypothetical protein